jgi:hypothetical protein
MYMEFPKMDPAMTALIHTHWVYEQMHPIDPVVYTPAPTQHVVWDGGRAVDTLGVAGATAATIGALASGNVMGVVAGVLGMSAAVTNAANDGYAGGLGAADSYGDPSGFGGAYGANAGANNGNGSAGPL